MPDYDVIIIGGGGFGSSAAYHSALRGKMVLVIDQFEKGHQRGSSHGETRVIRKAYFEHPDYVPLLQQSYKMWHKLEQKSQIDLISPCGLMVCGAPDSELISGTMQSAEENGLEIDEVEQDEFADRFPGFNIPDGMEVLYEVDGGFLNVEACVATYLAAAELKGTEFRWETAVTHWESDGEQVKVWAGEETFTAHSLIITVGAWAEKLLSSIPNTPRLTVLRKVMYWFPVKSDAYNDSYGSSCFCYQMPYGFFYGFPSLDGEVIKVCEHSGGTPITDPSQLEIENHDEDLAKLTQFLREVMPDVDPHPESFNVCMYTKTPDEHFIIDQHPQYQNVAFGAGFSGHGFKFVPILGRVLSDLALDYETDQPVKFLGLNRFQM